MTFPTPSTALVQAWAAVPPQARALLELFWTPPRSSSRISTCQWPAGLGCAPTRRTRPGAFDLAAAHAVEVAVTRGFAILTAEPGPLRAIDPDVEIEELPAP